MRTLQIRELPEHIYGKLRAQAAKEHRSLTQQAVVTLEKGLGVVENPKARRQALVRELAANPRVATDAELPDPVSLVREDRSR